MSVLKTVYSADATCLSMEIIGEAPVTTEKFRKTAKKGQFYGKPKQTHAELFYRQNCQSNAMSEPDSDASNKNFLLAVEADVNSPTTLQSTNSTSELNEEPYNKSNAKKMKNNKKEEPEAQKVEERKTFSLSTQLYLFGEHLAMYNRLYQESYPQLMCNNTKFYIETENNGVGCLDLLFSAFCDFMKMDKIKNLPTDGGERVFCWLGKRKATELLPTLRPEHHFVNRLPLDIYLKDKQSLAFTLHKNTLAKRIQYKEHVCPYIGKRIPFQMLCPHQYAAHSMEPCTDSACFEAMSKEARNELGINKLYDGPMCPCFMSKIFVPETKVFASSLQQNVFIDDMTRTAPDAHWIVKPSYMRSGKGVRILSSPEQLRTFLKVKTSNRFMWGQNYVVQRYIKNPMLTNTGQKFDIRMFLLIVVTRFKRVLGFLHPGFVRKVPDPYVQLQKNEKFHARQHLAGTRVWRTYGPKNERIPPPRQPRASNTKDKNDSNVIQTQNNAKGKKKHKAFVRLNPEEPINRIGFYAEDFTNDECEEYNFAVRHGCLKDNKQNLPLIMTNTKVPELNPKPQPKDKKVSASADTRLTTVSSTQKSASASLATKSSGNPVDASGSATVSDDKQPAAATANAKAKTIYTNAPPDVPPGGDPWSRFSTNEAFLLGLRSMVSNICTSVFDQIKEKANCYQIFSMDVCIDEEGKPWLLEVNPSIATEKINWNSRTIREVIPGVLVESLALVCETTRKGLSFLALRTPKQCPNKPDDLVFRQNFLWLYSTPDYLCSMFELKQQKYAVEKQHKLDLTSRGINYVPVDYYPEKNQKLVKAIDADAAKKVLDSSATRCAYRFPSPVANIPLLEEDVAFSLRYTRVPLDAIKRQTRVRHMQKEVKRQRKLNEDKRLEAFKIKRSKPKSMLKERFAME